MSAFLEGLVAGYGIAIPVGAIALLIVGIGMRCGFQIGFMAGAGAASADFVYAIIAMIAGASLAATLEPVATELQVISGSLLLGLGGFGLRRGLKHSWGDDKTAEVCGPVRMFWQFLGITVINPLTVVYFTALILGRYSGVTFTIMDRVVFVVGAGLASLSWQTLLVGLGAFARQQLSPRFQLLAVVFGNLVVTGLGLRILLRILI